ncbi:MAG: hypothetical protein L3J75_07685 [Methylococcaceae bacterium]|nr:hypothetical protein [Methylococcaceae bacterium]
MILAKDFIETSEGLVFAVVESGLEQGKVLCFLRYIKSDNQWQKLNTDQANHFLTENYPQYLYYSSYKQAHCHGVALEGVFRHHSPRTRLKNILADTTTDEVETDLITLCQLYKKNGFDFNHAGVTGSILIGAQKYGSDIDLVFYSREAFNLAREITQKLITQGACSELSDKHWLESFDRRSCDISYSEYLWHEQRKFNKAVINERKFDLTFVSETPLECALMHYTKLGPVLLKAQVVDDSLAFDYPAEFSIQHKNIKSIVSYTATYTGQAKTGEWVEVAGQLEQASDGTKRIVVGSSREAIGEYIKVIDEKIN